MDNLREVKQVNEQSLAEIGKCSWILTKGSKIGQPCGKTAISGPYCTVHKQCNPDLQGHASGGGSSYRVEGDYEDSVSDVAEKVQRMVIDESSTVEFVVRRKKVIITIE